MTKENKEKFLKEVADVVEISALLYDNYEDNIYPKWEKVAAEYLRMKLNEYDRMELYDDGK